MNAKLYKLMDWPKIETIIYSESDAPHEVLGPHAVAGQTLYQTYWPGAASVTLCSPETEDVKKMELADEDGFFAALLPGKGYKQYYYKVRYEDGREEIRYDAYRFSPVIKKSDTDKFEKGIHYSAYEILGAHPMTVDEIPGVHFAVWAPNAMRVSVVGDFNSWDGRIHQMRRLWDSGIFEIFIPGAKAGQCYKFELKLKGGLTYLKADPYGVSSQLRPDTASVIADLSDFTWEDTKWMIEREKKKKLNAPMSVYEMYLGSFAQKEEVEEDEPVYLNYRELAPKIISYVKEMGYTHIELMPIMEHPFDGSWGYQVIGYYAPTSRYGSPEDFMYFMNEMHKAGIGVILDWVPAHFPRDTHGLSNFDGTCLYEHMDKRQGQHPHWGTLIYNYGRPQVSNYLIANALYWAEVYHADGIRMDAVASMLYLDYGKQDGEWVANIYGGNENLEAIELIKHVNSIMKKRNPGVYMIAEESTAWPMVTGKLEEGGLGFDLKWNMGWMNDYLGYIKLDPFFRGQHHGELTFDLIYAYSEHFMLVFSHDEVVHGKGTILGKMPGTLEEKFKNLRLTYAYMMTHPGKKILFMGQDIGELAEWNEERCIEWDLTKQPLNNGVQTLVKDLNKLYQDYPALWAKDDKPEGFAWINCIDSENSYIAYTRCGRKKKELLLVVCNFSNVEMELRIGVPFEGKYKEILNTDNTKYGGEGCVNGRVKKSVKKKWDEKENSISIKLAPLAVSVLEYRDSEGA